MRISVIKEIDQETKEVYVFNVFELTAVFVRWHKETKPKGKRKWSIVEFWDNYTNRGGVKEPELPENIREEALLKLQELTKVKTWEEWSTNKH